MVELHIYLDVCEGKCPALENVFHEEFVPAIRRREGFRQVRLLKKRDAENKYEIDIVFTSELLRLKWVESPEHFAVWQKIEKFSKGFSLAGFDVCEIENR